jgi:hypothetical protein
MPINIPRPHQAPDWFTWFADRLTDEVNRADRESIKFLRKDFDKSDVNTTLSLGAVPANAVILKPLTGAEIHQAFNATITNTFAMGTKAVGTLYGSGLSLATLGFVPVTGAVAYLPSDVGETEITGTITTTGTAPTVGRGVFVVAYLVSKEA